MHLGLRKNEPSAVSVPESLQDLKELPPPVGEITSKLFNLVQSDNIVLWEFSQRFIALEGLHESSCQ
jgi:hypothetical protein